MKLSSFKTILLCWLCLFLYGCGKDGNKVSPGDAAKDFRLGTLEQHKRFYLNQHKGKVVVLVFWTTWCNVCKSELIELKSLADTPNSENLVIVGICCDAENINDAEQIVENLDIDYPVLLDKDQIVARKYGVSSFPATVIINRKWLVSFVREGYNSAIMNQIKTKVESDLASSGIAE